MYVLNQDWTKEEHRFLQYIMKLIPSFDRKFQFHLFRIQNGVVTHEIEEKIKPSIWCFINLSTKNSQYTIHLNLSLLS